MRKYLLVFVFLSLTQLIFAQGDEQVIRFDFTFNGKKIELNKKYYLASIRDSVELETIKLYISHLSFFKEGEIVDSVAKNHHLIDLENENTLSLDYPAKINSFDKIEFSLGIDSLTNVSGVMGGDLDPTTGMYWAWQSGYINFKLEGKSKSCRTRNNVFQFHLGGYQFPNSSFQTLEFSVSPRKEIVISIPIDKFLTKIDIQTTNEIMSPGEKAVELSKTLSSVITIEK